MYVVSCRICSLSVLGNMPISVPNGHWFGFSGSRCFSELRNYSDLKRTLVVAAVEAVFNVVWLLAGDLMHFHMTPSEQKQIVSFCFSVTQMSSFWNNFFFCKFWKSTPGVVFPLLCLLLLSDNAGTKSCFGVPAHKSWDLCREPPPPPLGEWVFLPVSWRVSMWTYISCCLYYH